MSETKGPDIAVLLPCYNEEGAIAKVIADFRAALPGATIYVYDNNSADNTARVARGAGAVVGFEGRQGKGHVIRRMFADIEADIYVMADGDGTYEAAAAPEMVRRLVDDNLDMVVGTRVPEDADKAYRPGHIFGNRLLTGLVRFIFGEGLSDILSGYRVMSRRFVKSFPALSAGFETETEISIHSLHLRLPAAEHETVYYERAKGTSSKLSTYKDGFRILKLIVLFFKEIKPFVFFSIIAALLAALSLGLGIPVVIEYFKTGLVPRFPTAFLSAAIMLTAFIVFFCGVILDSLGRGRLEQKRLRYLATPRTSPPTLPRTSAGDH